MPSAQLGAEVVGVDIASNLVEAGNKRAAEAGLANCRFQEGDASDLQGLASGSFDLVVTIFGAMFAPRPFDVAKEMVRDQAGGPQKKMGRSEELRKELEALFQSQNKSSNKGATSIPATFLRVTVQV